ncbi:hypothetical protein FKM82_002107 [Ascaphus truei]
MAGRRFSGAPFGSQTARFDVSAVHPDCKKTGKYTQVPYCKKATSELETRLGPGTYNVAPGDFSPSTLQRNASGPGWKRAQETERLTEMPHLRYRETWERNRLLRQSMGPGRYNMKTFVELMDMKPTSVRGAGSRDARFQDDRKVCTPGPGTYGKNGNPYMVIEEKAGQSASSRGFMDSSSSKCRSLPNTGCALGPGTYNLKSSTDENLNHIVGKRGPYDIFSGLRSEPILFGYLASPNKKESEPGAYKVKTFIEELGSEHRKKHGVFGKISQYPKVPTDRTCCSSLIHWPRPANSPGPGYYDTKPLSAPQKQSDVPFLTSAKRFDRKTCSIFYGSTNPVGVGRYDITKHAHGTTATCIRSPFLSKTGRYLSDPERDKLLQ